MKRRYRLLIIVLFLMVVSAACENKPADTGRVTPGTDGQYEVTGPEEPTPSPVPEKQPSFTPTPEPTPTPTPVPEPEIPSITIAWWGTRYRNDSTIAVINLYRARNPELIIEYEALTREEYFKRLDHMADSEEAWDVFQMEEDSAPYRELMLPLNHYIDNGSIDTSDIADAFLQLTEDENGNRLGICAGISAGDTVKSNQMLCVSPKSKYPEEAVKFIDFFLHDIEANQILRAERGIPISCSVRDALSANLTEDEKMLYENVNQFEEETQNKQID